MTGAPPLTALAKPPSGGDGASPPFCIDATRTTILAEPHAYRAAFEAVPALLFDDVFAAPLMARLLARAETANFVHHDVEHLGQREIANDGGVAAAFAVMLDRPSLLQWLEQVTGLRALRGVAGAYAQTRAGAGHALDWHDDRNDPRRALGVVVNLTSQPYEGGLFEMRRKGTAQPLLTHHHTKPGTVLIFAVRPDLEHRVTPLTAGGPRRVFAGWFLTDEERLASPD